MALVPPTAPSPCLVPHYSGCVLVHCRSLFRSIWPSRRVSELLFSPFLALFSFTESFAPCSCLCVSPFSPCTPFLNAAPLPALPFLLLHLTPHSSRAERQECQKVGRAAAARAAGREKELTARHTTHHCRGGATVVVDTANVWILIICSPHPPLGREQHVACSATVIQHGYRFIGCNNLGLSVCGSRTSVKRHSG